MNAINTKYSFVHSIQSTKKIFSDRINNCITILCFSFLVACSGGGDDAGPENDQGNDSDDVAPIADAGPDQSAVIGDLITLDGSESVGANAGDVISYSWSMSAKPAGSSATIDVPTAVTPTFIADLVGTYSAQLVVTDEAANSDTDTVDIVATLTPPIVGTALPSSPPGEIPFGMKITCLVGAEVLMSSADCPVLSYEGKTYWAYSFLDNRGSLGIVAYDSAGNIVAQWEKTGARYIWQITVDAAANTVTFYGQGSGEITMSWAELSSSGDSIDD